MRTGHVAIGTAKPCCEIAKDLHLRGPPCILQQVKVVCNIIVIITIPLSGKRAWGRISYMADTSPLTAVL